MKKIQKYKIVKYSVLDGRILEENVRYFHDEAYVKSWCASASTPHFGYFHETVRDKPSIKLPDKNAKKQEAKKKKNVSS